MIAGNAVNKNRIFIVCFPSFPNVPSSSMSSSLPPPYAVRDEFLNLDLPNSASLRTFASNAFMTRLSAEHLEPMVQYFVRIRDEFSWDKRSKTNKEKSAIRQHIRSYLLHAEALSDIIIRHKDLAAAQRIPVPRVPWINAVFRANSVYGFEGDENQLFRKSS
ncbi:hypothetical protein B0H13DRAFT_2346736 [Mycena leptocephala]|nr:hypothetical protein B0H13DRAFT_2346736 [Mycena leptocephala]